MRKLAVFFFLLPFLSQAQSGWIPAKGDLFLKSDLFLFRASNYVNPEGNSVTTSTFSQYTLHVYGEYGLGKGFALLGYMPLLRWNQFETTNPVIGQGDLKVELKYQLPTGNIPVAISIAPEFPTGRSEAFAANPSIPGDGIILPTGDGEFNVWTTVAASKSLNKSYVSAYGSYNFRTTYKGLAFRDLWQVGIELGWNPIDQLWLSLKSRVQGSVGESQHPELGFVRGDATTFTGLTIGGMYQLNDQWGLATEIGGSLPGLIPFRNIYVAPYYGFGVTRIVR